MSKTFLSAAAVAVLSFVALDAQAFPLARAPSAAPEVTLVEGGCGPGFYRNEFGRCRPIGGPVVVVPTPPAVVVAPPVVIVEPRACPLGFHWSRRFRDCVR